MKGTNDAIIQPVQARYLEDLLAERDAVATAIEKNAQDDNVPIVDPEIGRFLYITAKALGARRILEIGTATGYSGLWLARALPEDGQLLTIDVDAARQAKARASWTAAGIGERVQTLLGPALEVIPTLKGPFDLLFIDAVKPEYKGYLDLALPLLRPGALVIVDNVLWHGAVALGDLIDPSSIALRDFNAYAMNHPRLTSLVIPVGDGLLYAIVNE